MLKISYKLKTRDLEIFKYLVNKKDAALKNIAEFLEVSELTVRNSIGNLNEFLKEHEIPEISKVGKYYNILPEVYQEKKELLRELFMNSTTDVKKDERITYILLVLLFEKKINLSKLAEVFEINRLTLQDDLTKIRMILKQFSINLESIKWQGIYLQGDNRGITLFGIQFITKILLEKHFHPEMSSVYSRGTNPIFYELYRKYLNRDVEERLYRFAKELVAISGLNVGVYQFNAIVATLIYCHINREADFRFDERKFSKKYKALHRKYFEIMSSCKGFHEVEYLGKNLEFIPLLLTISDMEFLDVHDFQFSAFIDENSYAFFSEIERKFKIKFSKRETLILMHHIICFKFKMKFRLVLFNAFLDEIPQEDMKLMRSIRESVISHFGDFHDEDIITLTSYLKNTILTYRGRKEDRQNIFIIDSSFGTWAGENLRQMLTQNYLTGEIAVASPYVSINWKEINSKFHMVLFLNSEPMFKEDILIPIHEVVWCGIPENRKIFIKFGLIEKIL